MASITIIVLIFIISIYYYFRGKKEFVQPQVMRPSRCWGKTKIISKAFFLFCPSDLTSKPKSHQSHHKDYKLGSPTGGSS